jgi:hypothetical protein
MEESITYQEIKIGDRLEKAQNARVRFSVDAINSLPDPI